MVELHTNHEICHLEIKGNNILVDINGSPKLTDYFIIYNIIKETLDGKLPY